MRWWLVAAVSGVLAVSCGEGVEVQTGTGGGGGGSVATGGGSGGGSSGPTSGTYACDQTVAGTHSCFDYTWNGGAYSTAAWTSACTNASGRPVTSCSRSGAVAGCRVTTTSAGVSLSTTTWYYSGAASTVSMACSFSGGSVVYP